MLYKFSFATIGVCVFYASASVGAFFNIWRNLDNEKNNINTYYFACIYEYNSYCKRGLYGR